MRRLTSAREAGVVEEVTGGWKVAQGGAQDFGACWSKYTLQKEL